jgi:hypothetical protein
VVLGKLEKKLYTVPTAPAGGKETAQVVELGGKLMDRCCHVKVGAS